MENSKIKKTSSILLIAIFVLSGIAFFQAKNIKIDYDFERFFPDNDPDLQKYLTYSNNFEGKDDNFILVGIKNKNGVFQKKFLEKIKSVGDSIQKIPEVKKVLSPCHNCFYIKQTGFSGFEVKDCISFKDLKTDSIRIFNDEKLPGSLFSKTSHSISFYISIISGLNKKESENVLEKIQKILYNKNFNEKHVAGKIITVQHYTQQMEEELLIFFTCSAVLVCLFLWFSYKAWWAVLVPLTIILTSIIWSVAIMVITGKSFDILMIMLPTIIFVVGMSDIVHFLNKYIDELRIGTSKFNAIKTSFKEIGLATLLTSITTSIGFFTLIAIDILPVKEFGIYSGISVIVAYLLSFLTLPLFLSLLAKPTHLIDRKNKLQWRLFLNKRFIWVLKNPKTIILSSAFLTIIGIAASSQLKVNTYLLEDLQESDPIKVSYTFFEDNFSGVRPVEVLLRPGKTSLNIYNYNTAKEIEKLESYLKKNYTEQGVGFMLSPLDPIKYLYSIKHNNNPEYFKLPNREKRYQHTLNQISQYGAQLNENKFINKDSTMGRISGKINDVGSYIIKLENEKLNHYLKDSIDSNYLTAELTGSPALLDKNNEKLSSNILIGLIIAFLIIGTIIGIIYRSFTLVGITLIVNALPLLIVASLMLLLGFDIKISTALIFTLAFGIAVDDTIHLLSKLKLELRKTNSVIWALKRSYLSTGKAIIITSLILCGGFLTLIGSSFSSIYSMGLFVSITLFIAVIIDLTLLPVLIIAIRNKISPNQSSHNID